MVFTIDEIAERLRVSRDTVRRLIERGELRAMKIGSQWRIAEEDLDAYVRRTTTSSAEGKDNG